MIKYALLLFCNLFFISCNSTKMTSTNNISTHVFRLKPGQDLRQSIETYVKENKINAGWVATCVGSLTTYNLRFANEKEGTTATGFFEIVSLVGTLSTNGSHIHLSVSDSTGKTVGGHLLQGCIVYTTAEIVLQSSKDYIFKREKDGSTPWEELQVVTAEK
jgi:uncharacterized protein